MDRISVVNSQDEIKLDAAALKKTAATALSFLKKKTRILSIYIVNDAEIKSLNYKYRLVNMSTDVLAFSMSEGSRLKGSQGILGDVVISVETAAREAKRLGKDIKEEMSLYLVHGILHLAGYDDANGRDRKKMEKMQKQILHEVL